jgi:transcriptional regulator with GAF, ATPase, and Fis domain
MFNKTEAKIQVGRAKSVEHRNRARRKEDKLLVKTIDQYNELCKVAQIITSEIDCDILFDVIIKQTNTIMGVERCSIFLLDEQKDMLNSIASAGVRGLSIQIPKHRGVAGWVFSNQKPAIVNNVHEDPRFYSGIDQKTGLCTNSILCVPLINKNNECVGALEVINKISGEFTSDDCRMLLHLSHYVAIALENARLFAELEEQSNLLASTNHKLEKEIHHRQKMESQLDKYRQQLEEKVEKQNAELQQNQKIMAYLRRDLKLGYRFKNMIGKSDSMREIYALVRELADVSATVLITGESGTGKELVAEALHIAGQRKDLPFVKVNCSALSESVLESELFGHVKGAFTGADKDNIGRFQKAANGTILLDEIGDISHHFQKRLLRVLQEYEFERLGSTATLPMNARVIAATNQDLLEKVRKKEFREDLYYRLKVVEVKVPPLRERKEDIPLLINYFLDIFNKELEKNIKEVSAQVMKIMMGYHWPGNIRELKNIFEHISILCKNQVITTHELPADFAGQKLPGANSGKIKSDDRESILRALEKAKWNKTHAAQLLQISRRTLYRKLNEYKIK